MKYANYNEDGKILGFYDDSIHNEIPSPKIPLTEEIWNKIICEVDNYIIVEGRINYCPKTISDEEIRAEKLNAIRMQRNLKIEEVLWLVERHRQQKELGTDMDLTDKQYYYVLSYIQKLRDMMEDIDVDNPQFPEKEW